MKAQGNLNRGRKAVPFQAENGLNKIRMTVWRCAKAAVFSHSPENSTVDRRSLDRAFQYQPGKKWMQIKHPACSFLWLITHCGEGLEETSDSGYKDGGGDVTPGILKLQ